MSWGKNRGCSFLESACYSHSPAPEFCNDTFLSCSTDTKSVTFCASTLFSNNCKMRALKYDCLNTDKTLEVFETVSAESQCHYYKNTHGTTAGCVKTRCDYEQMKYHIVKDDGQYTFDFLCEYKNQEHIIPNFGFTVLCEDPKVICTKKLECPNNCNGRGICMDNGKCLCDTFYDGDLCGRFIGCKEDALSICSQILEAQSVDTSTLSNDYASALSQLKEAQKIMEGTSLIEGVLGAEYTATDFETSSNGNININTTEDSLSISGDVFNGGGPEGNHPNSIGGFFGKFMILFCWLLALKF